MGVHVVISAVDIKSFRGIHEGTIKDLTPLVVLVGPNGAGKSTVIEAILIGASPVTAEAIVQVIRRHEAGGTGLRWLLWKGGVATEQTQITVATSSGKNRACRLQLDRGAPEGQTRISFWVTDSGVLLEAGGWVLGMKNTYHSHGSLGFRPLDGLQEVNLAEGYQTQFQRPLHKLFTKSVELGRRGQSKEIIKDVFPEVTNVEILTEHDAPILHLVFDEYSVPANLAGDGIQSLLRLTLELGASSGGAALLEEPEVHQHPGAIRQSARAILAAVRRDIQVILTTHSLELIDSLIAESSSEDLKRLSLYRLVLENGVLKSSRLPGPDVAFARGQIEDDLR
jgi:energy-coupling factor transporter ATP-binding protein EcfA2